MYNFEIQKRYMQVLAYTFFIIIATKSVAYGDEKIETVNNYVNLLVLQAHEMKLYNAKYWRILLHYNTSGDIKESIIDDPKFFLSTNGKYDSKLELNETIKKIFEIKTNEDEMIACRFPARFEWLKRSLNIDTKKIPYIPCKKLNFLNNFKPKSVTLVFPAQYNKMPSSMFGHAFLKINEHDKQDMIGLAVNYAAVTDNANIFSYAVSGLTGRYKGYYSLVPYYAKIKEYNNIESRDVWEYELRLTEQEIKKMFLHIIELQKIYSDYYFLDENCAYNLLYLIEAARPELELLSKYEQKYFVKWVLPTDTLRDIKKADLVKNISVRYSLENDVQTKIENIQAEQREVLRKLIANELTLKEYLNSLSENSDQSKIFSILEDYFTYLYLKEAITLQQYQNRITEIKSANIIETVSLETQEESKNMLSPDVGHGPSKIAFGFGYDKNSSFLDMGFRPIYHDLNDPSVGFVEGTLLNIFETKVRYYLKDNTFKLEKFSLIDVASVSPRNMVTRRLSWKFFAGLNRELTSKDSKKIVPKIELGSGLSYYNSIVGTYYGIMFANLNFGNKFSDNISPGLGVNIGILKKISDNFQIQLMLHYSKYLLGENHPYLTTTIRPNFCISQNHSISLEINYNKISKNDNLESYVIWNQYF